MPMPDFRDVRPNGQFIAQYIHLFTTTEANIAWEYLRRNEQYQKDYAFYFRWVKHCAHVDNFRVFPESFRQWEIDLIDQESLEFSEATEDQIEEMERYWGLEVLTCPTSDWDNRQIPWATAGIAVEGAVTSIPKRTNGRRRVLWEKGEASRVECLIKNGKVLTTVFRGQNQTYMRSLSLPFPAEGETLKLNKTEARHLSPQVRDVLDRPMDERRDQTRVMIAEDNSAYSKIRHHIEILRALDGQAADFRHREIAEFLYGEQRVAEDWGPGSSMRKQISRLLKKGKRLMDRGYLELLPASGG